MVMKFEKSLPLSWAHYPDSFGSGAFIGFSESTKSDVFMCSCSMKAIDRYLYLTKKLNVWRSVKNKTIVDEKIFPPQITQKVIDQNCTSHNDILDLLLFKDNICHKCENAVPEHRFCSPMYGGLFNQFYGWYLSSKLYENGVDPRGSHFCPVFFSSEIKDIFNNATTEYFNEYSSLYKYAPFSISSASFEHQDKIKQVKRFIENLVRDDFGYKSIGKENLSEKILFKIVGGLFKDEQVLYHSKPRFLNGLELDIYLPSLKLAIEYQGVQHYKPVNHWGGNEALSELKKRDRKKDRLCKINDIKLLKFSYKKAISSEFIEGKIRSVISAI